MAAEFSGAASLVPYQSGGASDGAATPTDPDLSIGNYRTSNVVPPFTMSHASPVDYLTTDVISAECGEGDHTIKANTSDTVSFAADGGAEGAEVTILNGETKVITDLNNANKWARVSRTSASPMANTQVTTTTWKANNAVGMDDVTSAERSAGESEYRLVVWKNESSSAVTDVNLYLASLGTTRATSTAQLGASGGGTITVGGVLTDWPTSGICRIEDSGGTLRENVYYSSISGSDIIVPAAGRAWGVSTSTAGQATDTVTPTPGIEIAHQAHSSDQYDAPADAYTAPTTPTFSTPISATGSDVIAIGTVAAGGHLGVWTHREIVACATTTPAQHHQYHLAYDAA